MRRVTLLALHISHSTLGEMKMAATAYITTLSIRPVPENPKRSLTGDLCVSPGRVWQPLRARIHGVRVRTR